MIPQNSFSCYLFVIMPGSDPASSAILIMFDILGDSNRPLLSSGEIFFLALCFNRWLPVTSLKFLMPVFSIYFRLFWKSSFIDLWLFRGSFWWFRLLFSISISAGILEIICSFFFIFIFCKLYNLSIFSGLFKSEILIWIILCAIWGSFYSWKLIYLTKYFGVRPFFLPWLLFLYISLFLLILIEALYSFLVMTLSFGVIVGYGLTFIIFGSIELFEFASWRNKPLV